MDRDLVAFELRPEYEPVHDGDVQTAGFTGGVLAAGRGDLHVRDSLDAGDGRIVIRRNHDGALVELLRQYPALVEVDADQVDPSSAFMSPYERWPLEELQAEAARRELNGADSTSEARLVKALDAHDDAIDSGAITVPVETPAPTLEHVAERDELEALSVDELREEATAQLVEGLTSRSTKPEIVTAMLEAGAKLPNPTPDQEA
jgi:hypothetical protein